MSDMPAWAIVANVATLVLLVVLEGGYRMHREDQKALQDVRQGQARHLPCPSPRAATTGASIRPPSGDEVRQAEVCGLQLGNGRDPERCGRPRGHEKWGLSIRYPVGVAVHAHSVKPLSYDAEVACSPVCPSCGRSSLIGLEHQLAVADNN